MALTTRMARLFRADLHALLDQIEDPQQLLAQSLREMDDALAEAGGRLEAGRRRQAALGQRMSDETAALAALAGELDLCFEAGNDDLARMLVRRRLERERSLAALRQQAEALARELDEQACMLEQRRRELETLRTQAAAQAPVEAGRDWRAADVVTDADVELALLREKRART